VDIAFVKNPNSMRLKQEPRTSQSPTRVETTNIYMVIRYSLKW